MGGSHQGLLLATLAGGDHFRVRVARLGEHYRNTLTRLADTVDESLRGATTEVQHVGEHLSSGCAFRMCISYRIGVAIPGRLDPGHGGPGSRCLIPAGGCLGTLSVGVSTVKGRPQMVQIILYLVGRSSGIPLFSHVQAVHSS